ncbi:MAG: hypothetical protein ACYS0D_02860 [Planctomycetota bacterium]|jgi:hypothetical protein
MVAPKKTEANDFDKAAAEARKEIQRHLDGWSARDIANWWKSWYMKAGHKRLGRILVELAG